MTLRSTLFASALLCALICSGRVAGQDPDPPAQPPVRDPFQAPGGREADAVAELPPVVLGGLILMRDRPALALLRLADQAHVVRVGTVLRVDGQGRRAAAGAARGRPVELHVTAIERDGVTLRVGDSEVEVVVR